MNKSMKTIGTYVLAGIATISAATAGLTKISAQDKKIAALEQMLEKETGDLAQYALERGASGEYFEIGDINNDGKDDLVFSNSSGITYRLQTADNKFGKLTRLVLPAGALMRGQEVLAIQINDLDKDGKNEIVTHTAGGVRAYAYDDSQAVSVYPDQ